MKTGVNEVLDYLEESGSSWMPIINPSNYNEEISSGELIMKRHLGRYFVTHPWYKDVEREIANAIIPRLLRSFNISENVLDALIAEYEDTTSKEQGFAFHLGEEQKAGVKMICRHPFAILTGGPGTGKTSVLKCAAMILKRIFKNTTIAFTAPTGKAARRVTESSGYPAMTVQKKIKDSEASSHLSFIAEDILFLDEVSMLDLETFQKLMRCLLPGTRLYLVGDVEQLPSVGIGAVLRDLIDSGVIPTVQLEQTFRQANDSTLFENIMLIKKGLYIPLVEGNDFIRIKTEKDSVNLCINEYKKARAKYGEDGVIILTATRKEGRLCSEKMNATLQNIFNPKSNGKPYISTTVYREGDRELPIRFQLGDPVIQLINRDSIANGDVGKVSEVRRRSLTVKYYDCEVTYDIDDLDDLDLAYALSIHKSQGSEYPCVILPFLKENKSLDRNMVYTGVTRAKKECVVIGEDDVIMDACKIQSAWTRDTFLCEELQFVHKVMELKNKILSL